MEEKLDKIIELLEKMEYNSRTYNGYAKWSYEQDELVDIMYSQGFSVDEIIKAIKEKFNIERSTGAIISRTSRLGLQKKRRPLVEDKLESEFSESKSSFRKKLSGVDPKLIITDDLYNDLSF